MTTDIKNDYYPPTHVGDVTFTQAVCLKNIAKIVTIASATQIFAMVTIPQIKENPTADTYRPPQGKPFKLNKVSKFKK